MPIASNASMTDPASDSDIFLAVTTDRGKIKGESRTEDHEDDIEVRRWSWGATSSSVYGTGPATARCQFAPLVVVKGLDSASSGLLNTLYNNAVVTDAQLSMRKAGGDALDYFSLRLGGARITGIQVGVDDAGRPSETVTLEYATLEFVYKRQSPEGADAGSFSFEGQAMGAS
jgi:type VI secretion system secreted protein Hcp